MDESGTQCVKPTCPADSRIERHGECRQCEPYTVPSKDGRSCVKPTCKPHQRILKSGQCEECGPYQRVTKDERSCEYFACEAKSRVINAQGVCLAYDTSCDTLSAKFSVVSEQYDAEKERVAQLAKHKTAIVQHHEMLERHVDAQKLKYRQLEDFI